MKENYCPKAERCRHAKKCICHDTFRGEYLCFESNRYDNYTDRPNQTISRRKDDKNRKH